MLIPISWLKEFVDIDIPVELLAERLTLAGLEVGHLYYIGVPQGFVEGVRWPKSDHLVWDRDLLVLGAIQEVKAHPDADRLVLAMVDYGGDELEQCVTGAPNLYEYKGKGPLETPLWTPFAKEGAEVWDGHSDTPQRMILKGRKLRGVYNKSMVCSEKELGISEEHEGILLMDDPGLPPGTPMQDVLGDVVLDIELTPNLARCYSVLGVAREVAALLDKELREPSYDMVAEGPPLDDAINLDIRVPELNPRFTITLLRDTTVKPSPFWMQYRLKLSGQRPINNIVDVTNYITFEIGQPLHAYDYDLLKKRVGDKTPTIITRLAKPGETLETLDEVKRDLNDFDILVCDEAGIIGLGGTIGGADTEIHAGTKNVLLEAANWNFIHVRRTMKAQRLSTDAGTRFSRGVHPSQSILGNTRGIELMRQTGGGQIASNLVDDYPAPPETIQVELPLTEIQRLLGMDFAIEDAADILSRLQFDVLLKDDVLHVTVPDHRMDISTDVIGRADLIEEIARIYGYDNIPVSLMDDMIPPQWANVGLEWEERARDVLVALGLRENISYRFTTPEQELLLVPDGMISSLPDAGYVEMANPISPDRTALRHTLLISLLENAAHNARFQDSQQVFEIGAVFLKRDGRPLPDEPRRLGMLMTGMRTTPSWLEADATGTYHFYDIKGIVEGLLDGLHIDGASYERATHTSFHPGRSALLRVDGKAIGTFGELHPKIAGRFELTDAPVMMAEFDLDTLLEKAQDRHAVRPLPLTPPVYQDIALVVPEQTPAAEVEAVIVKAGGDLLKDVRLFDVYRGESIPAGHKSLAYNLVYQTDEKTLTDKEVAKAHKKIVTAAEHQLGATLRA